MNDFIGRNIKYLNFHLPRKTPAGWMATIVVQSIFAMLMFAMFLDTENYIVGLLAGFWLATLVVQLVMGPDEYSDVEGLYYLTNASQSVKMLYEPMRLDQVRWHTQGIRGNFFNYMPVKDWKIQEQRQWAAESRYSEASNFLTQNSTRKAWWTTMGWGAFYVVLNLGVIPIGGWNWVNWLNLFVVIVYVACLRYKLMNIPPKKVDTPQAVA